MAANTLKKIKLFNQQIHKGYYRITRNILGNREINLCYISLKINEKDIFYNYYIIF